MTPGAKPSHRLSDRLGFRLGLVLSMALLPVGLIAVIQADKVLTDSQAQADAALAGEVLLAVAPGMRLVRQAQGAALALAASVLPVLSQPPGGCSQTLRVLATPGTPIRSAQVVALDGGVLCTSALSDGGRDDPVSLRLLRADRPMLAALTAADRSAPPIIQARARIRNALSSGEVPAFSSCLTVNERAICVLVAQRSRFSRGVARSRAYRNGASFERGVS
jgi:hypothetical protein